MREIVGDAVIYMNAYSKKLYQEFPDAWCMKIFCSGPEGRGDCLVEDQKLSPVEEKIEKIIVFRWNKVYPADMRLDLSLDQWKLESLRELEGSSHKILQETYIR